MSKIINNLKKIRYYYVTKVFASYMVFIVVSFAIILLISCYSLIRNELFGNKRIYTLSFEQATSYAAFKVEEVRNVVDTATNSKNVIQALMEGTQYYSHRFEDWNVVSTNGHKKLIYNFFSSSTFSSIEAYSASGEFSIENSDFFTGMTETEQNAFLKKMNRGYFWTVMPYSDIDRDDETVMYIRKIPSLKHFGSYEGFACAKISQNVFESILSQIQVTPNTYAVIYNSDKDIISELPSATGDLLAAGIDTLEHIKEELYFSSDSKETFREISLKNRNYFVAFHTINDSDWTLAMMVPYTDITQGIWKTIRFLVFWVIVVLILSLPFIYLVSHKLTKRIVLLKNEMIRFSNNTNYYPQLPSSTDEIGELINSFDTMSENLRKLMKEQYQAGVEIKDLELQILQSQINPHFLYNALETIYWMGIKNNIPEISEVAHKLGSFYQLSLANGNKYVPLSAELQHVQDYTDIQNIRFGGNIHLYITVPDELMPYEMIKITLQPLIENAIQHGIRERQDEQGNIFIEAALIIRNAEECLCVTIRDDGVGMTPFELEHMLQKNTRINGHGYGVWNINERIKITFGDQYGLVYSSVRGDGTEVKIYVPAILFNGNDKEG